MVERENRLNKTMNDGVRVDAISKKLVRALRREHQTVSHTLQDKILERHDRQKNRMARDDMQQQEFMMLNGTGTTTHFTNEQIIDMFNAEQDGQQYLADQDQEQLEH